MGLSNAYLLLSAALICLWSTDHCVASEVIRPDIVDYRADGTGIEQPIGASTGGQSQDAIGNIWTTDSDHVEHKSFSMDGRAAHDADQDLDEDIEIYPQATPEGEDESFPESPEPISNGENSSADVADEDDDESDDDAVEFNPDDFSVSQVDEVYENEDMLDEEGDGASSSGGDEDGSQLSTTMHKKGGLRQVKVVVASKTRAQVWRNYQKIGTVRTWTNVQQFSCVARGGDSITIISKGRRTKNGPAFGIAAMVNVGGKKWYVTGGRGKRLFKAFSLRSMKRMKRPDLRSPRRKMCFLPHPYAVMPQPGRWAAKRGMVTFLFKKNKAKYVWARKSSRTDVIGVRFVVGGDKCGTQKPTPSPSPKNKVGGARCACRVVRSPTKGNCFEFRNKRFSAIPNKKAACRQRVCGLKYECVQPGRRSKILCMRQFARFEVRSIGPSFKGQCKNVPLRPSQAYYAPYA